MQLSGSNIDEEVKADGIDYPSRQRKVRVGDGSRFCLYFKVCSLYLFD